jgi:putative effector of murein hydrolase LrgA (UPF0299 family)
LFQTLGESLAYAFGLPIPGPVIGKLFLFVYLLPQRNATERN